MGRVYCHYPGGKSKMTALILPQLEGALKEGRRYVEPFMGGGSVALAVAREFPNTQLVVNDRNPEVAAFWKACVGPGYQDLARQVRAFIPDRNSIWKVKRDRLRAERSEADLAFCFAILIPLTFNGLGRDSIPRRTLREFNGERLAQRIMEFHALLAGRTEVRSDDALRLLKATPDDHVVYLDPPYPEAGKKLYRYGMPFEDHWALLRHLRRREGPWLLSDENLPWVRELFAGFEVGTIPNWGSVTRKDELLIPSRSLKKKTKEVV